MTPSTVLLRQIHPKFYPNGELTSQAFLPFPKDHGKPSVYDSDQISAADAFIHYTTVLNNQSSSVWGVDCNEVISAGLTSEANPLLNFPSHSLINFTGQPDKEWRKLAKRLKEFALKRGCLHP
jgi:hypothetical protein